MTVRLDGIHLPRRDGRTAPASSRGSHWPMKRVGLGILILFLIGSLSLYSWFVYPFVHALSITSFSDTVTFARILRPGKYLVLFQNPRELRATGGFLGSFAEVETGWGLSIRSIRVETNIYTRDNLYAPKLNITPPEPLAQFLIDQPLSMRDSNWALDFPEAAKTVAWFYEHEGGEPVDGIIATDARLIERLVALTGPIQLTGQAEPIRAETVIDALQEEIEKNYWQDPANIVENQPKRVLAELMPQLLARIRRSDPGLFGQAMAQAFQEKEIMVAVNDTSLQDFFALLNWDGHIPIARSDYLYVNESNMTPVDARARIVGAKSSWSIDRRLRLTVGTSESRARRELVMQRAHHGQAVWPDGPNTTFIRVAVPVGSRLFNARLGETDITGEVRASEEAGKTVFGIWTTLVPGESADLVVSYDVPQTTPAELVIQRQPGMPSYPVEIVIDSRNVFTGDLHQDLTIDL